MYMSSGDEQTSRHTQDTHNVPMTKIQKSVLAAVSSLALFGGAMTLITPAAKAESLRYSGQHYTGGNSYNNGKDNTN